MNRSPTPSSVPTVSITCLKPPSFTHSKGAAPPGKVSVGEVYVSKDLFHFGDITTTQPVPLVLTPQHSCGHFLVATTAWGQHWSTHRSPQEILSHFLPGPHLPFQPAESRS